MRNRMNGAMVVMTIAAAAAVVALAVPISGQAGAGEGAPAGREQGACRGAAQAPATVPRPARIAGHPNINGIYQAITSAYWNIEDHSASATQFWQLGAIAAVPPGQSIVEGGANPYKPDALKQREANRKEWPKSDPEAKCYMPGIPRATYMPYPFQIVQGQKDILFVYEYASADHIVHMLTHQEPPVDSWMGWSDGKWDGDT